MKRVLYIGSGNPWLGGAGFLVRQNLFLRALAEVADLHLAMFDADVAKPPPFPCQFTALPSPRRAGASKIKSLLDDVFLSIPRMVRGYDLEPPRRIVTELQPEKFDAVFAYRIDFAHFAGVLDHPNLILDIDDPEHLRWQRRIRATTNTDGDWRTRRDLIKLRDFERNAVSKARLAFVCNANDQNGWAKQPQIVPNCVDVIESPRREVTQPRVLFVGNCAGSATSPNVDAVLFFLNDIWPAILESVPDAQFDLVGATSDTVKKAAAIRNVNLAGFVDNLTDIYARASISVAPIRFGTGTRIKILEAFAHACPVVSTTAGAEGIDATAGNEVEFSDTVDEFASRCVDLLNNPDHREHVGQAGHSLAARLYDRNVQHHRVKALLADLFNQ
jgi:polysaccharide biosynthesis protein PslH